MGNKSTGWYPVRSRRRGYSGSDREHDVTYSEHTTSSSDSERTTTGHTDPPHKPAYWKIIALVASIMALSFGLTFGCVNYQNRQEQDRCERTVNGRADGRSVWEYLIATVADPESQRVKDFVEFLNKRLPALECVDGKPTPVTED